MDKIHCVHRLRPETLGPTSLVCPRCGQLGTFESVPNISDHANLNTSNVLVGFFGLRRCPNEGCRLMVFLIRDQARRTIFQFPPSRISFESKSVPENIVDTLKEAIECHANKCDRAAAAMVRRTIEEICENKNAQGGKLYEKIDDLKDKVIIAPALFDAMHNIRFLGNDAVHIELKWFDDVGPKEVAAAIKITKKIIEAIYQADDLVKELEDLKTPSTP